MAKTRVEVCIISARGLRHSSSLWKLQWFVVGWINPDQKYCTKIDSSGSSNPTWKTKFSASIDESRSDLQGLALNIEVYSREPIFLRKKLHGTATVLLKEFFVKFSKNSERPVSDVEEVGSFQLRKKKSGKARGFIDISVQISEEREGLPSYYGIGEGGFKLSDHNNGIGGFKLSDHKQEISLPIEDVSKPSYPHQPYPPPVRRTENYSYPDPSLSYGHPPPFPGNYHNPSAAGPSYHPPRTPPPPPPPSNVGFLPTFLPGPSQLPPSNYINLPSSNAAGAGQRAGGPGFGMGVGAGALAAGAMIFGDDFMSGFDFPSGLQGGSLTISADPPF